MLTVDAPFEQPRHDEGMTPLLHRIRSEFLEIPDLPLTAAQPARFWAIDRHLSEQLLDALRTTGFLLKNRDGVYRRASVV